MRTRLYSLRPKTPQLNKIRGMIKKKVLQRTNNKLLPSLDLMQPIDVPICDGLNAISAKPVVV